MPPVVEKVVERNPHTTRLFLRVCAAEVFVGLVIAGSALARSVS